MNRSLPSSIHQENTQTNYTQNNTQFTYNSRQ